ncbi:PIN domain nuclease [Phragmitibacter flavus]|uniref:Ribonuclease VapC n=1 Tax=Phragmitibacter flavus TaxID=2576071 RepID=A0A5R8KB02_9BACT|nr:PIN domain-containing protein [Phragmitibacter flavus]TLD69486.1 PIN domain nuclease [Phragmitibacter flavus]
MARLIDSSLWVDFTRRKTPPSLKSRIQPWILDTQAAICEPIAFEILRYATLEERPQINAQFATLPLLSTPPRIWRDATRLGQQCRDQRINIGALDLLITAIAIHHDAELVTFDKDYAPLADIFPLRLIFLTR